MACASLNKTLFGDFVQVLELCKTVVAKGYFHGRPKLAISCQRMRRNPVHSVASTSSTGSSRWREAACSITTFKPLFDNHRCSTWIELVHVLVTARPRYRRDARFAPVFACPFECFFSRCTLHRAWGKNASLVLSSLIGLNGWDSAANQNFDSYRC